MPITDKFPVYGEVTPGFEPVRAAFVADFVKHGEVGAALHVTLAGKSIVDIWGGAADATGTRPWNSDTLVNVWSTGKGWVALAMHMLVDRGRLDFDSPVSRYWPEFARNGKDRVLVRHILTHTAGLPGPSMKVPDDALYDWQAMIRYLEQSELSWEPGTKCGYHAATYGWLCGEILRRITGKSVGQFLREEVARPIRADIHIGLGREEQDRTADTIPPSRAGMLLFRAGVALGGRFGTLAFTNPPRPPAAVNTVRWREAEIPSSNGHASARGLARLYTLLAMGGEFEGVRLLSGEATLLAGREQIRAKDVVTGMAVRRSLGFQLSDGNQADPRPAPAFGHGGMGGSIGFADPARRLAFGYVMNRMIFGPEARWADLCRALYACL